MHAHSERLPERLDKMVAAGRITDEEAERLRAAEPGQRDDIVREIRLNHARAKLGGAVEEGRLTQGEADDILGRLAKGERPRFLGRFRQAPIGPSTAAPETGAPPAASGHE
jgi:hypothetical protein